jgi:hypothetical protein
MTKYTLAGGNRGGVCLSAASASWASVWSRSGSAGRGIGPAATRKVGVDLVISIGLSMMPFRKGVSFANWRQAPDPRNTLILGQLLNTGRAEVAKLPNRAAESFGNLPEVRHRTYAFGSRVEGLTAACGIPEVQQSMDVACEPSVFRADFRSAPADCSALHLHAQIQKVE